MVSLVVFSILALDKLRIDDPVGAISVHGVVGLLGLLLVPVTNDGASFEGWSDHRRVDHLGWVFIASFVVWGVIKAVMGIRVSEEEEYEGVDIAECGMEAYPKNGTFWSSILGALRAPFFVVGSGI